MTYSSTATINRHRFGGRNQNTTTFQVQTRSLGPVSNTVILIVMACLLGLLYLTQVTKTNSYSYQISELQKQQTQLKSEKAELEINSARLQALDRIKSSQAAKNLVSVAPSATIQN